VTAASGFLLVRAAGRLVGLPVEHLVAVAEVGEAHPVPSPEPAMRGIAAVRGETMPVIHLGAFLAGDACPEERGQAGVIISVDGVRICLEVDDADVVVRAPAMPLPATTAQAWSRAVVRSPEGLVPLLDLTVLGARLAGKEAQHEHGG
jgi:chemotaxis signal transduction protein